MIIRCDHSSQDSKCYCCGRVLFNYSTWSFPVSWRFMRWFMIRKWIFTPPHPVLLQHPPLVSPDTRETSVGEVCLLNFIGVRCFQNAPRCLFFLDLRRKDEGGAGEGVKEDRWRWRRAEMCCRKRSKEDKRASLESLDTFYVSDEVDWFLPSAALRSHSLPLPSVMIPNSF